MDLARRVDNREWKVAAMREIDNGRRIGEVLHQLELSPKLLERWRGEWRARGGAGLPRQWASGPIPGLHAMAAERRTRAQDRPADDGERFPKKTLAAFQGSSPASGRPWRGCLFDEIRQAAEQGQAVSALCALTGLSPIHVT